jgi:hypothetical protein
MSSAIDTSEISSDLVPIRKKRMSYFGNKISDSKSDEIELLRNELINEKLQKNYYQIITAGLAVVLIAAFLIINF